jgi:hypothetical protein
VKMVIKYIVQKGMVIVGMEQIVFLIKNLMKDETVFFWNHFYDYACRM